MVDQHLGAAYNNTKWMSLALAAIEALASVCSLFHFANLNIPLPWAEIDCKQMSLSFLCKFGKKKYCLCS